MRAYATIERREDTGWVVLEIWNFDTPWPAVAPCYSHRLDHSIESGRDVGKSIGEYLYSVDPGLGGITRSSSIDDAVDDGLDEWCARTMARKMIRTALEEIARLRLVDARAAASAVIAEEKIK